MDNTIIVTRHPALVEYLQELGLATAQTQVLQHATASDVQNKHVFGVLPLHLAALTAKITEIPLALTPDLRGKELDLATVRRIASEPVTYKVTVV